jgi:hypothetical protein
MADTLLAKYTGRAEQIVPVNFSLTREAAELLVQMSPTLRGRGAYITRLLLEERARQEERARMKAELAHVLS